MSMMQQEKSATSRIFGSEDRDAPASRDVGPGEEANTVKKAKKAAKKKGR
jgi:hypothetical protein